MKIPAKNLSDNGLFAYHVLRVAVEMFGKQPAELSAEQLKVARAQADKTLGPCPESDHQLLVRRSRRGSVFVGCDGYPECRFTLPLPDRGEPLVMDEVCEEHGLRHVRLERPHRRHARAGLDGIGLAGAVVFVGAIEVVLAALLPPGGLKVAAIAAP